jgi:hypothetical protein
VNFLQVPFQKKSDVGIFFFERSFRFSMESSFFFWCLSLFPDSDVRVGPVGKCAAEQQSALIVFRLQVRHGRRAALDPAGRPDRGEGFGHAPVGSVFHSGVELHQDEDLGSGKRKRLL